MSNVQQRNNRNSRNSRMLMKFAGSSVVKEAWYNRGTRQLTVRLKSDVTYVYLDVPWQAAVCMIAAESPGRYFNTQIKNIYETSCPF